MFTREAPSCECRGVKRKKGSERRERGKAYPVFRKKVAERFLGAKNNAREVRVRLEGKRAVIMIMKERKRGSEGEGSCSVARYHVERKTKKGRAHTRKGKKRGE